MTIDEAIIQFKEDAEYNRADLDLSWAEENEQVAKWLEELKDLREYKGKVEWVIKTHKQIKEETIDKCIKIVSNADVDISPSRDIILKDFEKLKEQNK